MGTIAAFLLAITSSVTARVLTSLGIGFVSYAAITSLLSTITSNVTSNYNAMSSSVLQLVNLAGFGQAFGIIIAALTARASLIAIKRLAVL